MADYTQLNGRPNLLIQFGYYLPNGSVPPLQLEQYLGTTYESSCDIITYRDKNMCYYHKGIDGLTTGIDDTVSYLQQRIDTSNYQKVICLGIGRGGYAALLFGSLCRVSYVLAFTPQTLLPDDCVCPTYKDIKTVIQSDRSYIIYSTDINIDRNNIHHISQTERLRSFSNVIIHPLEKADFMLMKENGEFKNIIDAILGTF